MADYSGGRVRRIKLKNFLTYDDLELFPSTGLNLIIGRNGTGKSSIVCGICLGLAGKPLFTGRATQISDYIKHGCKEANIEIELENKGSSSIIINRKIKQDNKSTWLLNKKMIQESAVKTEVEKFNIQTNNLCQFLPQEKVSEFSKMDKKQRLENMLQAIGDQNLYVWYEELKLMQKTFSQSESNLLSYKNTLEMEKQKNERLQVQVDKQIEKSNIQDEIKILEDRKIILIYEQVETEFMQSKRVREERKAEAHKCKAQKDVLSNNKNEMDSKLEDYGQKIKTLDTSIDKSMKSIAAPCSAIIKLNEKIQEAKIELANKIEENNGQKKRILELKQQINGLKNSVESSRVQYENLANDERRYKLQTKELQEEKSDILSKKKQYAIELNHLRNRIEEIKREIVELKNEDNKKMEVLRKKDEAAYKAAVWLNKNKDKFKGVVHPPIFTQIKVINKGDEKYIENHISGRDMTAFVCEDPEDSKLLVKILREEMNLAISTVMAPDKPLSSFQPRYSSDQLKQMKFNFYLKDLFTAPDAVMRYLCNLHNVHQTPVGDRNTENLIKNAGNSFPFSICYTPQYKYIIKRSRYGNNNQSVTTIALRNPSFLVSSTDVTDKIKMLEKDLEKFCERIAYVDTEFNKLSEDECKVSSEIELRRKKSKEIEDRKRAMQTITTTLTQKIQMLKDNEQKVFDEAQEKKKTATYISKCCKEKLNHFNATHEQIALLLDHQKEKLKLCINQSTLLKKKQKMLRIIREADEQLEAINKLYLEQKAKCKNLFNQGQALLHDVRRIQDTPYWESKVKQKYFEKDKNSLPHFVVEEISDKHKYYELTLEQIDRDIQKKQTQIDLTHGANDEEIAEYQQRKVDIAELEDKIKVIEGGSTNLVAEMQDKKEKWLAPLEGHIKKVNEKFKQYFKLLKCAGEIILDKNNDSNEFDKYGLQIMLKYRDSDPLMELSQHHHSGGECSVAAILFILSLQELTKVPFRCIDEINQGMDSINERKVFELIANSANNEKSSQYFLLTPKLLPGLTYHEKMKIHVIYNGPFLDFFSWNMKKIIENRENCVSD